jgi:hypothetical protein
MRYLQSISFGLLNLGCSLTPENPVAWLNAVAFFGCLAMVSGMLAWDTCEFVAWVIDKK